jgi:hypothetical protein
VSALADLRARVEAATKPSQELDAQILQVLFVPKGYVEQSRINGRWCIYDGTTDRSGRPRLWEATGKLHEIKQSSPTASLDAVLALVGEKLPDNVITSVTVVRANGGVQCIGIVTFVGDAHTVKANAPTPALALLSAVLAALDASGWHGQGPMSTTDLDRVPGTTTK